MVCWTLVSNSDGSRARHDILMICLDEPSPSTDAAAFAGFAGHDMMHICYCGGLHATGAAAAVVLAHVLMMDPPQSLSRVTLFFSTPHRLCAQQSVQCCAFGPLGCCVLPQQNSLLSMLPAWQCHAAWQLATGH
jgi:hypothetical protein